MRVCVVRDVMDLLRNPVSVMGVGIVDRDGLLSRVSLNESTRLSFYNVTTTMLVHVIRKYQYL
jgi:hypothetical protein